ncbi:FK506-binding protein 2-like isoform X3 [Apium graveolens]|uniref:FK506-binding protein 2-like isoform X3 n=1 Tax=Apium graveolens TaxID=4045 RepID=UPI003D798803
MWNINSKSELEGSSFYWGTSDTYEELKGKLTDGTVFNSIFERGDPIEFELGWDHGLLGMCMGEKRKLKIPAKIGYGAQGSPPTIPGLCDKN